MAAETALPSRFPGPEAVRRAGDIRRPRIVIKAIGVQGDRARVKVRTTATGQSATTDVILLTREAGKFRIESLG